MYNIDNTNAYEMLCCKLAANFSITVHTHGAVQVFIADNILWHNIKYLELDRKEKLAELVKIFFPSSSNFLNVQPATKYTL